MRELMDTDRQLTRRELEVLSLAGGGLTQHQIAARLVVAKSTVHTHLDSVRAKLRVHTTEEAVKVALKAGLIPVEAKA